MSDPATKLPIKSVPAKTAATVPSKSWHPLETLRQRLMDDFDAAWVSPFRRSIFAMPRWDQDFRITAGAPAIDIVEKDHEFELTAELPGLDEKHVEVTLANGGLSIKGEKEEKAEERKKDYYLQERSYGSFERTFRIPDGVDTTKIEAVFKNGVLTVALPKKAEAQKAEKKITIKAA